MEPTTLLLAAGVIIALAIGVYQFVRLKARQRAAEAVHHFRCPGCQRRLRFRARQVGHKGKCSHCGQAVVFPLISESVD